MCKSTISWCISERLYYGLCILFYFQYRYTLSALTWIGPGSNVTCTSIEGRVAGLGRVWEEREESEGQRPRSQPCIDLCEDYNHVCVSEKDDDGSLSLPPPGTG